MIQEGDGTWHTRLSFNRCPKCDTMLPDRKGGIVVCKTCSLGIAVKECSYKHSLGECRDGMVREPDGEGCVQWTSCHVCAGKGWTA